MIHLTFTLSTPEIIRLTRNKQLGWVKSLYWIAGIGLALLVPLAAFINKWGGIWVIVASLAFMIYFFEWAWPRMTKRQLEKLPSWGKPVSFEFSEADIRQKTANGEATLQWQGITKAEELPDWFLLHLGPKMVYLSIPKRAFESADKLESFRALLISKNLL